MVERSWMSGGIVHTEEKRVFICKVENGSAKTLLTLFSNPCGTRLYHFQSNCSSSIFNAKATNYMMNMSMKLNQDACFTKKVAIGRIGINCSMKHIVGFRLQKFH